MPIIDDTLSALAQIRTKVRRLTRSPSVNQITDQQINDYVNTFVLYDFPQHLRLFSLKKILTFYTQPYIEVYENNTVNPNDPMYNFINKVTSVHGPIFVNGVQILFSQSREQFYKMWPKFNNNELMATGDGVNTVFSGTLSYIPIMENNVTIASRATSNAAIVLKDKPILALGNPTTQGQLIDVNTNIAVGTIDYVTGVYQYTLAVAPASGVPIYCEDVPYLPSIPTAVLYFDNKFHFRPIPKLPHRVEVEVFVRPTELLSDTDETKISQWWQYIAYGAAKKIFEDRLDMDSVQLIMPEFKQQELLVLRQTILQNSNERSATIFTGPNDGGEFNHGFGTW